MDQTKKVDEDDFSDERKFALLTHIESILTFVRWLLVLVCVLVAGSFLRSYVVQHQVDDVGDAAKNALDASNSASDNAIQGRDVAVDVKETLDEILAEVQSSDQPALNAQAVNEALAAIARLEGFLCGGPCPTEE